MGLLRIFSLTRALCASLQVRSKPPPGEAGAMHSGRLGSAAQRCPANSRQPAARAKVRNGNIVGYSIIVLIRAKAHRGVFGFQGPAPTVVVTVREETLMVQPFTRLSVQKVPWIGAAMASGALFIR